MQRSYEPMQLCIWGDRACFTRPEASVERVSYEVPTPSASRGILESIFWKPEFHWQVREIHIMKPIRHFSILRNEVTARASYTTGKRRIEQGGNNSYADMNRTQRHTLGLSNVAYQIFADVIINPGVNADSAKYRDQFRRRVERGQCHSMPFLGCREFSVAGFGPAFPDHVGASRQEIDVDLGQMLYDLEYQSAGQGKPKFFRARLVGGVLHVPQEGSV